ncbi:hypothetical protein B0H63DRAFT_555196 [Podospora didyma]|uniref:CFEM domain-containing protein n=1 Tax=Podospora didyma TaxID=330526 RepID=A0AAE0P5X2_9PEZI|nr:hypothetical protein B0H63DRAFT_555196 [Podospora didyma]
MKLIIIVTAAAAGVVMAQSVADLPPCGKICVNNMLAQAPELDCPIVNGQPDPDCLCNQLNFGYGIRDCAAQACLPHEVGPVISHGLAFCANVAAPTPSSASDGPSTPGAPEATTAPAVPAAVSAMGGPNAGVVVTGASDGSASAASDGSLTLRTAVVVSTYTSGNATLTTTLASVTEAVSVTASSDGVVSTKQLVASASADSTVTSVTTIPSSSRSTSRITRTSTTTASSASSSVSEAVGASMPRATVVKDSLFAGAAGIAAVMML